MSLWLTQVDNELKILRWFEKQSIRAFMFACIDHAFFVNRSSYQAEVPSADLALFFDVFNRYDEARNSVENSSYYRELRTQLCTIFPYDDDEDIPGPAGWGHLVESLQKALIFEENMSHLAFAQSCAGFAYGAVSEPELQIYMRRHGIIFGEQITFMENASRPCREEIDYQLFALDEIYHGITLPRLSYSS